MRFPQLGELDWGMGKEHAVAVGPATTQEWANVAVLLRRAGLPSEGLEAHRATLLVARRGSQLVGCAALELYGTSALLRSVAVEESQRGAGLGIRLTQAALALGRRLGVERFYLLTDTAREFFPRFGFREIARDEVDPAVLVSEEFRSLCPASATVMVRAGDGSAA